MHSRPASRQRRYSEFFLAALATVPVPAVAAAPSVAPATNYQTVPMFNDLFAVPWGASPYLTPGELFWEYGRFYSDSRNIAAARKATRDVEAAGKVPISGLQRWQDTYAQSFPPGTFPTAPAWIKGAYAQDPAFRAWSEWLHDRPQYADVARDGGSYPPNFRAWGGSHGDVLPLTPLEPRDVQPGMPGATYGDLIAFRWGQVAAKTGVYGVMTSDFSDSLPHGSNEQHGFNPRIIAQFEAYLGHPVAGKTVAEKANTILATEDDKWTEFWCQGWTKFLASIMHDVAAETGHAAVLLANLGFTTSILRNRAFDERIVLKTIPSDQVVFDVDTLTMSPERGGGAMAKATEIVGQLAAYEPNARVGAILQADDATFWAGVDVHWKTLSPTDKRLRGYGELKRLWLETGWMHIADRSGAVRRGVPFLQRSYWDHGKVPADVLAVMREHIPARPFGMALYYSSSVARARQTARAAAGAPEEDTYFGMSDQRYTRLRDAGVPIDYFVSDASLGSLRPAMRPAAWVVLESTDPRTGASLLPPEEMQQLQKTAPVLLTPEDALAFHGPLRYGPDTAGVGFYDTRNNLVITASNLLGQPRTVSIHVDTLPDGNWTVRNLFSHASFKATVTSGSVDLQIPLAAWDTTVLTLQPAR